MYDNNKIHLKMVFLKMYMFIMHVKLSKNVYGNHCIPLIPRALRNSIKMFCHLKLCLATADLNEGKCM